MEGKENKPSPAWQRLMHTCVDLLVMRTLPSVQLALRLPRGHVFGPLSERTMASREDGSLFFQLRNVDSRNSNEQPQFQLRSRLGGGTDSLRVRPEPEVGSSPLCKRRTKLCQAELRTGRAKRAQPSESKAERGSVKPGQSEGQV